MKRFDPLCSEVWRLSSESLLLLALPLFAQVGPHPVHLRLPVVAEAVHDDYHRVAEGKLLSHRAGNVYQVRSEDLIVKLQFSTIND